MIGESELLRIADGFFKNGKYSRAFFIYSQLLVKRPNNKRYKLYVKICDIAYEDKEKAISLYDYFFSLKENDINIAIEKTESLIKAYDGDLKEIVSNFKSQIDKSLILLDAIEYNEFKQLVDNKGSFKIALQDVMLSTKIALRSRKELFDFLNKLIDNDFHETAFNYIEMFPELFQYDKKGMEILNKLFEKSIQNKLLLQEESKKIESKNKQ